MRFFRKLWFFVPPFLDHFAGVSATSPSAFSISILRLFGIWFAIFIGAYLLLFVLGAAFVRTAFSGESLPEGTSDATNRGKEWRINTMRMSIIGNIQFPWALKLDHGRWF